VWSATISLPANTPFEYKYVKRSDAGSTVWETGTNRSFTTPASGQIDLNDEFRAPFTRYHPLDAGETLMANGPATAKIPAER
jgi:hypothetical protein